MNDSPPRDSFLRDFAETRRFLSGRPSNAKITPDGTTVRFLRSGKRDAVQTLFAFDVASGQSKELLTPANLLKGSEQTMSAAEKARLERQRISARGFTHYDLSKDGTKIVVGLSGKLYLVDRASNKVTPLPTGDGVIDPHFSQDGRLLGYVRDNDVYALDLASLNETRVTEGGTEEAPNGLAEFVAQEEMSRFSGYWFSPDGTQLAYEHADHKDMERFAIVDPMHPEKGADSFPYPRPGQKNATVSLFVKKVSGGEPVEVKWDSAKYPYLATVVWPKKGALSVLVQNREQTEEVLFAVDPQTGTTTKLLTEKDAAWINLDQDFPHWRDDGQSFLWYTERNGGPEIEERDSKGALKSSWVKPDAGLGMFVGLDEKSGTLYFVGSPDATEQVLWRVTAGGKPERVPLQFADKSNDHGWQLASMSQDGKLFVVNATSATAMPHTAVYRADGSRVGELPSVAEEPKLVPNVSFRQVGERKWWSALILPKDFKKGQKYPVIVEVYGGPGHAVVHRTMRENLLLQWFADQGFIVCKFDNRGTPGRGREWERAIKYDFATVALGDQAAALHALAKEVPEMDLNRVGIEGWSFGGYMSALAAEQKGDLYKAAVAGAPVVDWLDYDTHYTERYLGVPEAHPDAYKVSSLLTYAPKLSGKLLLIHGTADDNVYFFHSLKLSDALFKAGKPHEMLPLSGFTHMVPDPLVTERLWTRIAQHFKDNLR
ncbi:MAG: DPP IV N-terminal domain-containing protein [Myxococcaceae bacterium]